MSYHLPEPRFALGRTVATPAVLDLGQDLVPILRRHHCGDWGNLCDEDKQANEDALAHGQRLLSTYDLTDPSGIDRPIYVITEWDRSVTTILLTEEY